MTRKTEF